MRAQCFDNSNSPVGGWTSGGGRSVITASHKSSLLDTVAGSRWVKLELVFGIIGLMVLFHLFSILQKKKNVDFNP